MNPRLAIALLLLGTAACLLLALLSGSVAVAPGTMWDIALGAGEPQSRLVVLELRLPRALAAFATGGALALAGALMQVLLRNPLADPYILGISGGAAVAALLAMLAGVGGILLTGSAFLGALLSMALVFGLAQGSGAWTPTRLLLTGVVIASGWGALISLLLTTAPGHHLPGMLFWLMGDLSRHADPAAMLMLTAGALALCWLLAGALNVMSHGEVQAGALGVHVSRLRLQIYLIASLLTAGAVATAGTVGFVGLITPHLLRLAGITNYRWLLPGSVLLGGCLLLLADTLARTVLAPQQLPVGVLTALLGVPLFLYLLRRSAGQP